MIITSLFPSFGVICGRERVCLFLFVHMVGSRVLALRAFVSLVRGQRMRKMRVSPLCFPPSSVSPGTGCQGSPLPTQWYQFGLCWEGSGLMSTG